MNSEEGERYNLIDVIASFLNSFSFAVLVSISLLLSFKEFVRVEEGEGERLVKGDVKGRREGEDLVQKRKKESWKFSRF